MNSLLKQISEKAIELADFEFTQEQFENKWLGNKPALEAEIKLKEKRLGIEFSADFKKLLSLTNGFSAPNDIEPTFEPIDRIDFVMNIDASIIETYSINGIENVGANLKRAILIAGINEEQKFLLIPPNQNVNSWLYWKFTNWIPGEEEYQNLEHYFTEVLEFLEETIETGKINHNM